MPAILFLGIMILGNACSSDPSSNTANDLAVNNSNINGADDTGVQAPCLDLEQIKGTFPDSVAKQVGKNFTMEYEPRYKVLTISGAVHAEFNDLRGFIGALNNFRNKTCLRMVVFKGKDTGEEFRWCKNIDCSPKVPDATLCTQGKIKDLYKNVPIGNQIEKNKLNPVFNKGNDGKLDLEGQLKDEPKDRLTKFLEGIDKEVGGCIATLSFSKLDSTGSSSMLSNGFEWQICEHPEVECYGSCCTTCPCKKDAGNSNANVNSDKP